MDIPTEVAAKVEKFFSAYPKRTYGKGEILVLSEDSPKYVYYLIKGQVREYDISHSGDEVVVNVFKPGAFFPMSWAINRNHNAYFYGASTAVETKIAPPDDVVKFIKDNPDVMFDLLRRLYAGTDGLLRRMAHLMGSGAKNRLLFELLLENRRFGKPGPDNTSIIHMSETELGARAGLSRETISREMNDLKKRGLISINRQGITIVSVNDLEKELGSEL
jgi:CRP/FNR family transcriptional regulator, cyclic AMP receptor protein